MNGVGHSCTGVLTTSARGMSALSSGLVFSISMDTVTMCLFGLPAAAAAASLLL